MQLKKFTPALLAACVIAAAPVGARVTEINIAAVEPFADGAGFGAAGAYERVRGTFKGEIDPADPRNKPTSSYCARPMRRAAAAKSSTTSPTAAASMFTSG